MNRFVVLAAPRTGSNLLCTLLQSHPDVLCHHELFNPSGIFYALPLRDTNFNLGTIAQRESAPLEFLQRVWNEKQGNQLVGFKMTHVQQAEVFNQVCLDREVYKIVLKRKARLKTYVSRLIAEHSGVWEDYQSLHYVSPLSKVKVNYQKLKSSIQENDQYYKSLDELIDGPRMDIYYEDIFDRSAQKRLLDYLNLNNYPLKARSRQQNPYPVSRLIENRDSLEEKFSQNLEDTQLLSELNDF